MNRKDTMQHPNKHSDGPGFGLSTLLTEWLWAKWLWARAGVRLAALAAGLAVGVWWGPVPSAWAQELVHVVARGENLSTVAHRYGLSQQELAAYNGIANPNLLWVGQRLQIPGSSYDPTLLSPASSPFLPGDSGYHLVAGGQTLSEVAKAYGLTTGDLMRLNNISNANLIWAGQRLRVTARVEPVPASVASRPAAADEIYVVQAGDTLAAIAQRHQSTVHELLAANGLPNPNFVWVGQRLRLHTPSASQGTIGPIAAPADGLRRIEINLSSQTLTAWQGDVPVLSTTISSGRSGTPTVTGRFAVGTKYPAQRMVGPGYDLPNVPWVMYFHGAYAIHGAYWHNNFGVPASHGCVNMRPNEAELLYHWAAPGTEVYVHN